jgi:hypothetical protein
VKLLRLMMILAGAGVSTTGCYTLEPTSAAAPAQGTRLAFAINDVGRVALGGVMGPELRRVEGSLQSMITGLPPFLRSLNPPRSH